MILSPLLCGENQVSPPSRPIGGLIDMQARTSTAVLVLSAARTARSRRKPAAVRRPAEERMLRSWLADRE